MRSRRRLCEANLRWHSHSACDVTMRVRVIPAYRRRDRYRRVRTWPVPAPVIVVVFIQVLAVLSVPCISLVRCMLSIPLALWLVIVASTRAPVTRWYRWWRVWVILRFATMLPTLVFVISCICLTAFTTRPPSTCKVIMRYTGTDRRDHQDADPVHLHLRAPRSIQRRSQVPGRGPAMANPDVRTANALAKAAWETSERTRGWGLVDHLACRPSC
jgi:hypothetical protein